MKFSKQMIMILILRHLLFLGVPNCENDLAHNGHCYKLFTYHTTSGLWTYGAAVSKCLHEGGYPVAIQDFEEQIFIEGMQFR